HAGLIAEVIAACIKLIRQTFGAGLGLALSIGYRKPAPKGIGYVLHCSPAQGIALPLCVTTPRRVLAAMFSLQSIDRFLVVLDLGSLRKDAVKAHQAKEELDMN